MNVGDLIKVTHKAILEVKGKPFEPYVGLFIGYTVGRNQDSIISVMCFPHGELFDFNTDHWEVEVISESW